MAAADLVSRGTHAGRVIDVEDDVLRQEARRAQAFRCQASGPVLPRADDHVGAAVGERAGGGQAEAAVAAGDECEGGHVNSFDGG